MMHSSTFEYLKPTDEQIKQMAIVREAAKVYCQALEAVIPDGPDKTYIIRAHRSNTMWANVAITRLPDGTPRQNDKPISANTITYEKTAEERDKQAPTTYTFKQG